MSKKNIFFYCLFLIVIIASRIIFAIPNQKYLDILKVGEFHLYCVIVIICVSIIVLLLKISKPKKMTLITVVSVITFFIVGVYYYANLPKYTYEEAVKKIENYEVQSGNTVELKIPTYREDQLGVRERPFYKTTNYSYFIYVDVNGESITYRFNPLNGAFEKINKKLDE